MQKPKIESEVYNNNKKCDCKKKFKSLISFLSFNKINNYNRRGTKRKWKRKSKINNRTTQNISIINVFLWSLLSGSFPMLGVTVHLTS